MANYTFRPPTVDEGPAGGHRLFYFYKLKRGITVVKSGSIYSTLRYAVDEDLNEYDVVYRGGYNHTVNDTVKAELLAAGLGITEDNFTAQ
jgi:hypothetical protein